MRHRGPGRQSSLQLPQEPVVVSMFLAAYRSSSLCVLCLGQVISRAQHLGLIKHLERYPRRIHGRRPSGIECQMGNEPVDFVLGHPILQCPPDMAA